jgi:ribonucleoside-diphosphate reductase alpha chain
MTSELLATPIARHVWEQRYRRGGAGEVSVRATWRRVTRALAAPEGGSAARWEQRFLDVLDDFAFLPGGRVLAGAGTSARVTLFNCFVMGIIDDSIPGIFRALQEGAVTMQQGGGVGYDFSTLRPQGMPARTAGTIASGPISFMDVWDAMCATIQSTGARRGAMMATLRCDHPDVEAFIDAKRTPGRLRHFNLSVQITDDFFAAVTKGETWPLVFPAEVVPGAGEVLPRLWTGAEAQVACRVVRRVHARGLWEKILRSAYDTAEPGVLFIDRINSFNNLRYCERITATNPCGEVPLPPHGACCLGSINLARLVHAPFSRAARLDTDRLTAIAATAVRLLDNVIEVSRFPLPAQQEAVRHTRRVGLGITGLADALLMLGLRYGSDASLAFAAETMRSICHAAYRASIAIAAEKGSFPAFSREPYLDAPFIRALPPDIRDGIARSGIRNSHLLAIAPTGTISLLAGNVSSGMEPIFAVEANRDVQSVQGTAEVFTLTDYAVALWRDQFGHPASLPPALVTSADLPVEAHLAMQATLQTYVDNAISKTINMPATTPFEDFAAVFESARARGLKGCTVFRPTPERAAILTPR